MIRFLKLGGSLITDKRQPETPRIEVIRRLAQEITAARALCPDLRLVIGHGSGSFGHRHAAKYGTRHGVQTADEWFGFALTADAAARLTRLVVHELLAAGVPVWSIQPSAALLCVDGQVVDGPVTAVMQALERGLVPLVHGDVALDRVRGGTIVSTEELFEWLLSQTNTKTGATEGLGIIDRLVLAGEVDGLYTADPQLQPTATRIRHLTPPMLPTLGVELGGSYGVDVTGGMAAKVSQVFRMMAGAPGLDVVLCSGLKEGVLLTALTCEEPMQLRTIGTHLEGERS